eukprot:6647651-Heterocapsa_arctica.AAC.1
MRRGKARRARADLDQASARLHARVELGSLPAVSSEVRRVPAIGVLDDGERKGSIRGGERKAPHVLSVLAVNVGLVGETGRIPEGDRD